MIVLVIILCCVFLVITNDNNSSNNSRVKEYHGFDWDAYWKDIGDGMDIMDRLKKKKRGDYWITTPHNKH